jgi:GAF domain-containing protein
MDDGGDELDVSVDALSKLLLTDEPVGDALERVARLAAASIAGCDVADVTLMSDGDSGREARSDPAGPSLDEVQLESGDGPVFEVVRTCRPVRIDSIGADSRWPTFAAAATEAAVASCLVIPMMVRGKCIGALNLYGRRPAAFDDDAEQIGIMFASQAAVVLANAQLHQACVDLTGQLEQALVSRAVIEQAKGIVMGRDRCDAEEAFLRLRRRSQHENRKVRDLARELVEQVTSA